MKVRLKHKFISDKMLITIGNVLDFTNESKVNSSLQTKILVGGSLVNCLFLFFCS